jgi:hypothetical protein
MNRPILIGPKSAAADVAAYEKNKDSATEKLHEFLVRVILSELSRVETERTATTLTKWINCVQSGIPNYAAGKRPSDPPTAYFLPGVSPRLVLIYSIDRGYEAVSQFTYFFEVYSRDDGAWKLIASHTPHQFDGGSLNVSRMTGADTGEHWFLLTGKHYGDTGARLYLELLAFDGHVFRELWSEIKPKTWVVNVLQDHVVLGSEELDKDGRNAHEVTRAFNIEKRGLQPAR